jgi:hypothetical protein
MSGRNQEGRSDGYDSSHHSGHPGKHHGVDNDFDHSWVPFEAALRQRPTLARRWRQVGNGHRFLRPVAAAQHVSRPVFGSSSLFCFDHLAGRI